MKILAIDMDGTLLNSKKIITEDNLIALRKAKERGIEIIPITGRTLACLPFQLKKENLFRYVITSNGANIIDLENNVVLYQALIPINDALFIIDECRKSKIGITVHIGNDHVVQGKKLQKMGKIIYKKDADNTILTEDILEYIQKRKEDIAELQFFYFSKNKKEKMKKITQKIDKYAITYSSVYAEIFSKNATKGKALLFLANLLGVNQEDIICIGDSENDISMFNVSKTKYAMGNAIEDLKNIATEILPNNDNNGVKIAIDKILGENYE